MVCLFDEDEGEGEKKRRWMEGGGFGSWRVGRDVIAVIDSVLGTQPKMKRREPKKEE